MSKAELVNEAEHAKADGFRGTKIKVGHPEATEDLRRLEAVRSAVGREMDIMIDANQAFSIDGSLRRVNMLKELDLAWLEEPLPADSISGHSRLSTSSTIPIAIGESIYSIRHFREYMSSDACSIVQPDVSRVGGITPWLKVAHMAEAFGFTVCPHFLMELHVSLVCGIRNGGYLEYIPQLDNITESRIEINGGHAFPPSSAGIGIDWDWDKVDKMSVEEFTKTIIN